MTWAIAEGDLPSTVAPSGTFSVPYPAGYSQADFIGANAATDHRFVLNNNELFKASLGQISVAFGETSVVITNLSAISWTFETPFIVQLDIEDNPQAEAEQQAATTFETTAEFVAADAIPETKNVVRLLGHLAAGDGNDYLLARRSSEPSHPGKRQQHGIWWEMVKFDVKLGLFAVGDGETDDSDAVRDWLLTSTALGVPAIAIKPSAFFLISDVSVEPGNKDLQVRCGPGVVFKAPTITDRSLTRPMLNIDTNVGDSMSRPRVKWFGGKFDSSGLAYGNPAGTPWDQGSGGARGGCLGFTRFRFVSLEHVFFQGGQNYFDEAGTYATAGYVGGDQGCTFINCKEIQVNDCHGDGMPDNVFYPRVNADMSAPNEDSSVGVFKITNSSAKRCYQMVYAKYAGGRLIASNLSIQDCNNGIIAWGDYNPGGSEGGTQYQPFDAIVSNIRAERIANRTIDFERVEVGAINNVTVSDWGRRLDGVEATTSGRPYVPAVAIRGCQNVGVSNLHTRLRRWNGGLDALNSNAYLEAMLIETQDAGSGDNSLECKSIVVANCSHAGVPITVVDGQAVEQPSSSLKGTGAFARLRGFTADGVVRFSNIAAPDVKSGYQKYIFNGSTKQFIDNVLVASPDGAGYTPGKEFVLVATVSAGVVTIPTQLQVGTLTLSIDGSGASTDVTSISGSFDGQTIIVRRETSGESIVLKNGGNLSIGADKTLAAAADIVMLNRRGNTWYLVYSTV